MRWESGAWGFIWIYDCLSTETQEWLEESESEDDEEEEEEAKGAEGEEEESEEESEDEEGKRLFRFFDGRHLCALFIYNEQQVQSPIQDVHDICLYCTPPVYKVQA